MEWDKLKVFYHIAKSKSISQAAKTLNTSQSALSRTLQLFEDRINSKLFHRQSRGIILTKQGQILFRKVQIMMDAAEEAIWLLQEEEIEAKGNLKIIITQSLSSLYLSPYVPEFLRRFPEIRLDIFASDTFPNLSDMKVDAYIGPHYMNHHDLIENHKMRFHFKLYASPEYLEKFGTPKKVEDLDNHRLIGAGNQSVNPLPILNWHLAVGKPKGKVREAYIHINDIQSRCFFAQKGLGILTSPSELPGLIDLGLIEILPQVESPAIDVYCSYSVALKNSKKIKILDSFLDELFTNHKNSCNPI